LTKRLLTFFERVDPSTLASTRHFWLLNIRGNLDGDQNEEYGDSEEEWRAHPRFPNCWTDEEIDESIEQDERRLRAQVHFIADLGLVARKAKQAEATAACITPMLTGKFYASPAPTGRAKCQHCHGKIAKGSVRVSEHHLTRHYSSRGSWTARQSENHHHAICFLLDIDAIDANSVSFTKEAMLDGIGDSELSILRDEIVTKNKYWDNNKEWNHILSGAVSLHYKNPGRDDSARVVTTGIRKQGIIAMISESKTH
jgi:hypothetical protein